MQDLIHQFSYAVTQLMANMPFILVWIGIMWGAYLINLLIGRHLILLGIYPRKLFSLPGIFFSPFIHGHFNHLFFNSIPLIILSSFVLLQGLHTFYCVSVIIILLGGLGVWLFARPGFHIGASGLIMGYWSYLLISAYFNRSLLSIAPALVCVYYFGGFLFHLFPKDVKSSFEGHIAGAVAGILAFYICPHLHAFTI